MTAAAAAKVNLEELPRCESPLMARLLDDRLREPALLLLLPSRRDAAARNIEALMGPSFRPAMAGALFQLLLCVCSLLKPWLQNPGVKLSLATFAADTVKKACDSDSNCESCEDSLGDVEAETVKFCEICYGTNIMSTQNNMYCNCHEPSLYVNHSDQVRLLEPLQWLGRWHLETGGFEGI